MKRMLPCGAAGAMSVVCTLCVHSRCIAMQCARDVPGRGLSLCRCTFLCSTRTKHGEAPAGMGDRAMRPDVLTGQCRVRKL